MHHKSQAIHPVIWIWLLPNHLDVGYGNKNPHPQLRQWQVPALPRHQMSFSEVMTVLEAVQNCAAEKSSGLPLERFRMELGKGEAGTGGQWWVFRYALMGFVEVWKDRRYHVGRLWLKEVKPQSWWSWCLVGRFACIRAQTHWESQWPYPLVI